MSAAIAPPRPSEAAPPKGKLSYRLGLPFISVHVVAIVGVLFVGWSPFAVAAMLVLYLSRAFGITAFYHRLLAHKAYETSRPVQFLGALWANSAAQKGPLWWVAHHRSHHKNSDQPADVHSPVQRGFLRSHVLWMFEYENTSTEHRLVRDLARYRELRFLDKYHYLAPTTLAVMVFFVGLGLGRISPGLTDGPQLLIWGFFVSTVVLWHATFMVNSVAHLWGTRDHDTRDDSRNNALVAALTMGEGWHNNHHAYASAARHGWRWYQVDPTWLLLRFMSAFGLVWDLRPVPPELRR
jgi:stearoyl-CoA desaturase (Delta-9 desaturase)